MKAIQWGRDKEATALEMFKSKMGRDVIQCGIFLHPTGLLGASPDGVIDQETILEIKCPYKYRDCTYIMEATNDKTFFLSCNNGAFSLKTSSDYYHQIQGQLHITGAAKCYLVVYIPKDIVIVPIWKESTWAVNIEQLLIFSKTKFIPYILNHFICDVD